jgi:hypothetical protein
MAQRRLLVPLLLIAVVLGLVPAAASSAQAGAASAAGDQPWGPRHVLYDGHSTGTISQATTTSGVTVATFGVRPRHGAAQELVSVQTRGGSWSPPAPVSSARTLRPKVIAWGAGQLSVIFQIAAGQDTYTFRERTLQPDGTLAPARKLFTAHYAYPSYQAAINTAGDIALAWANGDLHDRVVIVHRDGSATELPPVPVRHPTSHGLQFIANPKALFLDDSERVSDLTWGTLDGSSRAIWLMRLDGSGAWRSQRVAPLHGGVLDYGYVDEAAYAANTHGDLAVSWQQRDPATKKWSTELRYAPAGASLGAPTILADEYCFIDNPSPCADLAMSSDGTATVAFETDAGDDTLVVNVARRTRDGSLSTPQAVSTPIWVNTLQGVQVAGNADGDTVVSFTGGDHRRSWTEFARCPADLACTATLRRRNDPSWLDSWVTSLGPSAGVTVTWSQYYHSGLATRHLSP